ncbi:MAG: M67 family metallopeptidase [Fimbriiglobus sp.]
MRMSAAHHAELIALAAAAHPLECCGLLAGQAGHIEAIYPIPNELGSPVAFRTEPWAMLQAQRKMRTAGQELLAIYHSHPTSPPIPSRLDLAENPHVDAVLCVIIHQTTLRAWRLYPDHAEEVPLEILPS